MKKIASFALGHCRPWESGCWSSPPWLPRRRCGHLQRCRPPWASTPHYGFIAEIRLAGDGGWDYRSVNPAAGCICEKIEDKNLIVAIDVRSHAIVNQWPIAAGEGPVTIAHEDSLQ